MTDSIDRRASVNEITHTMNGGAAMKRTTILLAAIALLALPVGARADDPLIGKTVAIWGKVCPDMFALESGDCPNAPDNMRLRVTEVVRKADKTCMFTGQSICGAACGVDRNGRSWCFHTQFSTEVKP
jgi:hypothetical protein